MIVTLTANPALDLTYTIDSFASGQSIRTATALPRAGGKGVNVARILHAQQHKTLAIVPLGGFVGDEFGADLVASGVPHTILPVASTTRRSLAIVESTVGDTTVLNEVGTAYCPAEWASIHLAAIDAINNDCDCLVISGSLPPQTPATFLSDLIARARDNNVDTIVDVSGPWLLSAARAGAAILKPNRQELFEATGIEDPLAAAQQLCALGAENVVVSLGGEGMLAVPAAGRILSGTLGQQLSGNPTGAGDAAVAALASLIGPATPVATLDWAEALRRAISWSASAVLMPLAGELSARHTQFHHEVKIGEV